MQQFIEFATNFNNSFVPYEINAEHGKEYLQNENDSNDNAYRRASLKPSQMLLRHDVYEFNFQCKDTVKINPSKQ